MVVHKIICNIDLPNSLYFDRVTTKVSLRNSPFFLVYGKEVILPTHIFFPSLKQSQYSQEENCPVMQHKLNNLLRLEEEREESKRNLY